MRRSRRLLTRGRDKTAFTQPPFWSNPNAFRLGRSMSSNREWLEHDFQTYISDYYKDNGIIFACILARMWVFSEALLRFQHMVDGRPGDLYYTPALEILDHPEPGKSTGDMLLRMEQDDSLGGNSYQTFVDDKGVYGKSADPATARIVRMPPDQVEIVIYSPSGNPWGLDARKAGYIYKSAYGADNVVLLANEVSHFAPIPDPAARWRGMSWVTPVIREIQADREAMEHKKKFFENGATLGYVVSLSESVSADDFDEFVEKFNQQHQGVENAYDTLFLGGGADVTALGTNFKQLEFSKTQGAGETRIAAAAGVPPVIAGFSEGLAAATYSNYGQARRRFVDGSICPLWRIAAGALSTLVPPPTSEHPDRLWYDARDIPFLREDLRDRAEITLTVAQAVRQLQEVGWEADAAVLAADSGDMKTLVGHHTGMMSVQLVRPGETPGQQQDQPQPQPGEDGNADQGDNSQP